MIAYVALFSWPVVVTILFRSCSKQVAFLVTIVAGYLLLPTQTTVDLPLLPPLDKNTIPALSALIAVLIMASTQDKTLRSGWLPRHPLPRFFLFLLILGIFLAVLTNREMLIYGPRILPALRLWDGFSTSLLTFTMLIPFILGRKLLARPEQQHLILVTLTISGLAYSFLALFEIRMSPQLNVMVYGFFPHQWLNHIRGDGYRPLVFLHHGLHLAIFFSSAILSVLALIRISTGSMKTLSPWLGLWLLITLVLSKSLGALAITIMFIPVICFLGVRLQLIVGAIFATIVLSYPMLRSADLVPMNDVLQWAETIDAERARSLNFRFENEDLLLERARLKPFFGWGGWARGQILNEAGAHVSTTDGYWVIIFGEGGWIRYLCEFGLLCLPIILAAARTRKIALEPVTSALSLVLVANLIDLIPNASLSPITWVIAGSLWGRLEQGRIQELDDITPTSPQMPYSRYAKPPVRSTRSHLSRPKQLADNRLTHTSAASQFTRHPPKSPEV